MFMCWEDIMNEIRLEQKSNCQLQVYWLLLVCISEGFTESWSEKRKVKLQKNKL